MQELLPPSRSDRLRSVGLVIALLGLFAVISGLVDGDDKVSVAAVEQRAESTNDVVPSTGPIEGEFLVSGSSTVYPIVLEQAEVFSVANPGVAISVEGPGSGDGAQKFCDGEVPIANASRLYKNEELEICDANGIEYIELRRGIDGITVMRPFCPRAAGATTALVFATISCVRITRPESSPSLSRHSFSSRFAAY